MRASSGRRLAAWLVDTTGVLMWAGVLAAVTWPHRDSALLVRMRDDALAEDLVGFLTLIAPVTVALSWAEHRWGRTPGKRLMGLRVVSRAAGGRPSLPQALGRNAVKVALPWTIAHAAVFALVHGTTETTSSPAWAGWATALSYVLPLVYVGALFTRTGRTPYDAMSRTAVLGGA